MVLRRDRAPARAFAFAPPQPDRADRALSALAGTLFLASWVVAYVGLVPPDGAAVHRANALHIDMAARP